MKVPSSGLPVCPGYNILLSKGLSFEASAMESLTSSPPIKSSTILSSSLTSVVVSSISGSFTLFNSANLVSAATIKPCNSSIL